MLIVSGSMAHGQHHGQHGNPDDLDGYIAKMEAPDRAEWQRPDDVVKLLALKPGQTACDVGAGPGYFALRLAKAVGAQGRVFAADVEPRILAVLRERIRAAGLRNVTPVLALDDDALLPRGACDLILIVDTFHHFPDGTGYLRRLREALAPGGHVVNIDFHKRDTPVGPPVEHRVAREEFLKSAEAAGLMVVSEPTLLPYQYFLVMKPR